MYNIVDFIILDNIVIIFDVFFCFMKFEYGIKGEI